MIINRHNYEELFLLYVDNELTPAQRAEVEVFVQQNEDLADELTMLQQATLMPEQGIEFDAKHLLYKKEQGINLANCEEYFLLDVDNELSSGEKAEVEKFVLQHPQTQEAFTLLHQTRLEPESIVFENKAVLYRREERRIVPMRWMRMAAAAAIIGIAGVLYLTIPAKDVSVPNGADLATQAKPKDKSPGVPSSITADKMEKTVAITTQQKAPAVSPAATIATQPNVPTRKEVRATKTQNNSVAINQPVTRPALKTNNLPERINNTDLAANDQTGNLQNQDLAPNINNRSNSNTIAETKNQALTASKVKEDNEELSRHAIYREIDNNNEEEENSFLIGSARINKNKLRGLLKKASTIFNKKGDKNENQKTIQIAGFEIKS